MLLTDNQNVCERQESTPDGTDGVNSMSINITAEGDEHYTGSDSESEAEILGEQKPSERKRKDVQALDDWLANQARILGLEDLQDASRASDGMGGEQRCSTPRRRNEQVRAYQQELYERASVDNVIAVLPTGAGKTLIATMLLKDVCKLEVQRKDLGQPPRTAFFLVDKNFLAKQQTKYLQESLYAENIICCTGDGHEDWWSSEQWKDILGKFNIVVCTAEVLNQALGRGYVKIPQINLLILDEAHHTKKDHPYARIIKDHYLGEKDAALRPRIFSMTASPVDAKADVVETAQTLETLLHSRIATSVDESLIEHCPRPIEVEWIYEKLRFPFVTDLCRQIILECDCPTLRKNINFAKVASSQLGPKCADMIWDYYWDDDDWTGSGAQLHRRWQPSYKAKRAGTWAEEEKKLERADQILAAHRSQTNHIPFQQLSSKVLLLRDRLENFFRTRDDVRCIIFVEQRATALILRDLFKELMIPGIRPAAFVGIGSSSMGGGKFTSPKQQETLDNFDEGATNCLFATSVAEEGLDIQECNLVIRFDPCMTMIQYLQSRGRARQADSVFVHMLEAGNQAHRDLVNDAREAEVILQDFCNALPEDRILQASDADIEEILRKDRQDKTTYHVVSSGAKLTPRSSLIILENYASTLRRLSAEAIASVEFVPQHLAQGSFQYMALLPDESPFRGAIGESKSRKLLAKQSAAYHTCVKLYELGHLDDTFNSTIRERRPLMANAKLALKGTKQDQYDMQVKPHFWKVHTGTLPSLLYANHIMFKAKKPLLHAHDDMILFTRVPLPKLPAFPVYLDGDIETSAEIAAVREPLLLDDDGHILDLLTDFTLGLFLDLFGKSFKADNPNMPYWLAPFKKSVEGVSASNSVEELLDLDVLHGMSVNPRQKWVPGTDSMAWVNRFIVDPWSGKYRYFTEAIYPGLGIRDPLPVPPKSIQKDNRKDRKKTNTILDYCLSLRGPGSRKKFWDSVDNHQPVFKAKSAPMKRNLLEKMNDEEKEKLLYEHAICPQALEVSALPSNAARSYYAFPSLITRIDAYLVALECCDILGLTVNPELALEAVTKDSHNAEEHRAEQIHFKRGMGKNYERLEFIGDTFLKMSTSISLFIKYPSESEFDFHVHRMLMICNDNLFDGAVMETRNLPKFIRTQAVNRRLWYPEGLVLFHGKDANPDKPLKHDGIKHSLAQKTISDVCEALIGAAYLTAKENGGRLDVAVKAVTKLVNSSNHEAQSWAYWSRNYALPKYQVATADSSDRKLQGFVRESTGYGFRYPRLLQSAFTHPSCSNASVPNYQRLEFLGDALYDMVCVDFLFGAYPDKDPQWLTEHKMAMVSNRFLAVVAVELGFFKYLQENTISLREQIRNYAREVQRFLKSGRDKLERDFWTEIDHPPKALSDMIEAYIGAIFVDSNFDYTVVETFFEKHIRWYFEDLTVYDTFANKHPVTHLHKRLTDDFLCDGFRIMARPDPYHEKKMTAAAVIVHGEIISNATYESGKYARVKASEEALRLLEGLTMAEFRKQYNCDCRRGKDSGNVAAHADSAI